MAAIVSNSISFTTLLLKIIYIKSEILLQKIRIQCFYLKNHLFESDLSTTLKSTSIILTYPHVNNNKTPELK
ncbi:hypothetical protein BTR25_05795 [Bacillus sp. MRMR6]|nr:hypothetical protein BTR25_05795 [Bacillus sp. MRMR6]